MNEQPRQHFENYFRKEQERFNAAVSKWYSLPKSERWKHDKPIQFKTQLNGHTVKQHRHWLTGNPTGRDIGAERARDSIFIAMLTSFLVPPIGVLIIMSMLAPKVYKQRYIVYQRSFRKRLTMVSKGMWWWTAIWSVGLMAIFILL